MCSVLIISRKGVLLSGGRCTRSKHNAYTYLTYEWHEVGLESRNAADVSLLRLLKSTIVDTQERVETTLSGYCSFIFLYMRATSAPLILCQTLKMAPGIVAKG